MTPDLVWWFCVPIPLGILAVWGVVLFLRNWRNVRW